jgi:cytochrome c553
MLAGQPVGYLVKTLNDYKSSARIDEHIWSKMSLRAKALSEQGIEDIAVYFAAQKRY